MTVLRYTLFHKIKEHWGHDIEVAMYGRQEVGFVNAAIECLDCGCVIVDEDAPVRDESVPSE